MFPTRQCRWLDQMALILMCLAGLWMQVMSQNDQCGEVTIQLDHSNPYRVLESPGYPASASPDLHCRWTITAPTGTKIVLTVRDLHIDDNRDNISAAAELNENLGETVRLDTSVNVQQIVSSGQVVNVDWSSQSLTNQTRRFRLDLRLLPEGAPMQTNCSIQSGLFLCESSSVCVKTSGVCDSYVDCPDRSDESNCSPICPRNCSCNFENETTIVNCTANPDLAAIWSSLPHDTKKLILRKNGLTEVNTGIFAAVPNAVRIDFQLNLLTRLKLGDFDGENKLRKLSLNLNKLREIDDGVFRSVTSLSVLRLDDNNLSELREGMFEGLGNLNSLRLGRNSITTLRANTFRHLRNLVNLEIGNNPITVIEPNAFSGLSRLPILDMPNISLTVLRADTFAHLTSLLILDIGSNWLTTIEPGSFNGLERLITLVIDRDPEVNEKLKVDIRELHHLSHLDHLFVSEGSMCCLVDYKTDDVPRCFATKETEIVLPHYTCDRLMHNPFLRVSNWCLGISALIGNAFIIFWRLRTKDSGKRSQSFLILNLAVSDLIMGLYMLIIAGADAHFQESFYIYAEEWRAGHLCKFAGFLSMLSSEASVFFITMISIDRFLCVVFPFGKKWFRLESARVASLALWALALSISAPPPLLQNKIDNFYGLKDVCVGLPFKQSNSTSKAPNLFAKLNTTSTNDTLAVTVSSSPSYVFSIAVYLGVNLVCCLIVLACYAAIAFVVLVKLPSKKLQKRKDKDHRKKEIVMARRMLLIVGTDLCCWMPVILMVILSISDSVSISNYVHAWVVVFIIPINSAINPYLYTFSNAKGSAFDCCPTRRPGSSTDSVKMQPVANRDKDTITQRCRSSTNTLL